MRRRRVSMGSRGCLVSCFAVRLGRSVIGLRVMLGCRTMQLRGLLVMLGGVGMSFDGHGCFPTIA